jgi:hypothetical protein
MKGFKIVLLMLIILILGGNPANSEILFQEDFEDGNFVGWSVLNGSWQISAGHNSNYSVRSTVYGENRLFHSLGLSSFILEYDLKLSGPSYGDGDIFFQYYDQNNHYWVGLHKPGDSPDFIVRREAGYGHILYQTSNALLHNQWHHVRVERHTNGDIKVILDGSPYIEANDLVFTDAGDLVLRAWSQDVWYDNIIVYSIDSGPPTPGLIAYWSFDEGSGSTIHDQIGNNNGTLYGGVSWGEGISGSAAYFDGINDYGYITENTNLDGFDEFTISIWFRPSVDLNSSSGRKEFYYKSYQYQQHHSYTLNYNDVPGHLQFIVHDQSNWFNAGVVVYETNFSAGQWYNVIMTYDGIGEVAMYVNGERRGTQTQTSISGAIWDNSEPMWLAMRHDDVAHFPGALDEFRIYNRKLSDPEIQDLFGQGGGPIIINTGFQPSQHGFFFKNWGIDLPFFGELRIWGHCIGMSYAAGWFYNWGELPIADNPDCNGINVAYCGSDCPLPGVFSPLRAYINALQNSKFLDITIRSIYSYMTNSSSHISQNYGIIKNHLQQNQEPIPIAVSESGGKAHALLAYKIEEIGDIKKLYVYDSNGPECDDLYIELENDNGVWYMQEYTAGGRYNDRAYNVFAALPPVHHYFDSPLVIILFSPVDVEVEDSEGLIINKDIDEFENATYFEEDLNGDQEQDKIVLFHSADSGLYRINLIPEQGANPNDLFDILVLLGSDTVMYRADVEISQIPADGYLISTIPFAKISGMVNCQEGGLFGIAVDLIDSNGELYATTVTDNSGYYEFLDVPNGSYSLSIITPLGFIADGEVKEVLVAGIDQSVNFNLTRTETAGERRGIGFWKHQVHIYLSGNGHAQIPMGEFCDYLWEIGKHFANSAVNPIDLYAVEQPASQIDSLETAESILSLQGNASMADRAKQHLMATLLNVVSLKLHQQDIISEDSATASQAITYCWSIITDGDDSNDELAKNIAEQINNNVLVSAGVIPLDTPNISYKIGEELQIPIEFSLAQNYPNPFNASTIIKYALPHATHVTIEIYDIMGRKVETLLEGLQPAGYHSIVWNSGDNSSGVYFYWIQTEKFIETKKMLLIK